MKADHWSREIRGSAITIDPVERLSRNIALFNLTIQSYIGLQAVNAANQLPESPMNILQINSSLNSADGQSSRLAAELVAGLREQNAGPSVVVRDLARDPVPHLDA